jgi:alpha-D-xyloside xylohydrolase
MSGVPFCSHDVGGFDYSPAAFDRLTLEGSYRHEDFPKDPVVYIRWLQFGAFSSHMRAHGKQPREPWAYGGQAEEIARQYLKLRYRLLPYIYTEAVKCTQTGLPMVRPMVLEYQADLATHRLDLQYLFGQSFLVAPVLTHANKCHVYLPEGDWVDYWTKTVEPGRRWIEVDAPLDVLPLWVRAGAIIPMGPEMAHVEQKALDPLTLGIYAPKAAAAYVVRDEAKPDIPVRYSRQGDELVVEVAAAPGEVEIVLYGVAARNASQAGRSLALLDVPSGQLIRFDGREGARVTFTLET